MTIGLFGPQNARAVDAPSTPLNDKRYPAQTWVKDATAPGMSNGTVLDAAFFNRIIGALDYICTASGVSAAVGDLSVLFRAVTQISNTAVAGVLATYLNVAKPQAFTTDQKAQAAANLGLAAVARSGDFNDLAHVPALGVPLAGYALTVTGSLGSAFTYSVNQGTLDARYARITDLLTGVGVPGGIATLDMTGKITPAQLATAVANGIATLDSTGQLTGAQIPAALLGAVRYQGTWNATTNTPALATGVGTKGFYYIVATAGTTTLDGSSGWKVGDWAVFDGVKWDRIANSDLVVSVAGLSGVISTASLKTALAVVAADITDATSNGRSILTAANYAAIKSLLVIAAADISDASANGRSLITAANYPAMKALLAISSADVSGLGTAAALAYGTGVGNLVRLDVTTGKLPAVDGSLLTNLASAPVTSVATLTGAITGAALKTALAIALADVSGLGTAAALAYGTGVGNLVRLDVTTGKLPAVDGSLLTNVSAASFPAGTVLLFQQTAAPTGWTKVTTHDDKALRVVSGAASSGGTVAFSTVFGQSATGATTLTTAQMPAHTHSVSPGTTANFFNGCGSFAPAIINGGSTSGSQGGGGSHTHAMDIRVNYVDVILASKN
jgi:hypothetical protein